MSMTLADKLAMVKSFLRIIDTSEDALLTTYLNAAGREILSWRYSNASSTPTDVPDAYEMTQVQAVINGYTQSGNEGQNTHTENGTTMKFDFTDMTNYIRKSVIPIAGVLRSDSNATE